MHYTGARLRITMDFIVPSGTIENFETETACDFEMIVRLYRPRVFRFIFASLRDQEVAENLTQDCFVKAYKAYDSFRNECKISTWLMQIAVNLLRDHGKNRRLQFWRRIRKNSSPHDLSRSLSDPHRSPEAELVLQEQVAGIWKAADCLPEKQRTVFLLRFLQEMNVMDIALATGSKPATVKTHLLRAITAIRKTLGGDA